MMDTLISSFPDQLEEAMRIGEQFSMQAHKYDIRQVLVIGLGGSGIGGDIVNLLTESERNIPFHVSKKYTIPNYVNQHTLLIVSSYSGNTEETLEALKAAIPKNPKIVGISSNGQVEKICQANHYDFIKVPGGDPPRACLGYSMVLQLYILHAAGLIDGEFKNSMKNTIKFLREKQESIKEDSLNLAKQINGTIPVIYSSDLFGAVSTRYRQQINENSKMLCWNHVLPEMNHNELVGWRGNCEQLSVLMLRSTHDYYRTEKRIEISSDVFRKCHATVHEIWAEGETLIEQTYFLIHFGDWLSYYLAEVNGTDPIEIDVINYLKGALSKI